MSIRNEKVKVYEMTCTSCENRVEKAIKKLDGVLSIKVSFTDQLAQVEYDDELCSVSKIKDSIQSVGYSTQSSNDYKFMGILIVVASVVLLGLKTSGFDMESKLSNASYAVLFIVGVLTSLHCVGMCGGIMLSQTLSKESKSKFDIIKPSLLYNGGRVLSYTILGGIIGALGSVFSLSITTKAGLQIFAGIFMVMMGFNIAGFKTFRKFQIKLPQVSCKTKNKSGSPFIVGILNGLMPCGPLQTMQLFALGTGSATKGALSMFIFSIGTVPLMLTFGAISGILSKGYTKKILKFSGILIIVLGLIMGNRGFVLAGININPLTAIASNSSEASNANVAKATIKDGVQTINMTVNNNGYSPNAFYVQKGIPVKWIINGQELNSCNNAIAFQNKEYKFKKGETIIEFTPSDKDINFSCWMGMIRGVIKVTDKLDSVDISKNDPSLPPASSGPSCCAVPLDENGSDSGVYSEPGIYEDNITDIPTDVLLNKALSYEGSQSATFKGKGYELQPLIVVAGNSLNTKLTFDLSDFDNAEGDYLILNATTGDEISSFVGKKGMNIVEFSPQEVGGYTIVKNDEVLGIVEVVDDIKTSDLETIRNKYIGE